MIKVEDIVRLKIFKGYLWMSRYLE